MNSRKIEPENTAVRVALWRALHLEQDALPHIIEDDVGLKLIAPDSGWQSRPDMSPFTRSFRASILARARFIEDLVEKQILNGISQYVILGAGLDSFAQRKTDLISHLSIFEIDQPGPQEWKRQRLIETGFGIPEFFHLVPVDFEDGDTWWSKLTLAGFDATQKSIVTSTGVSMYLTRDAILATLKQAATMIEGSSFVMSFLLPIEKAEPEFRHGIERAAAGARESGTPFISFFMPDDIMSLAQEAGFKDVKHISAENLTQTYFANRSDGLRPPYNSEELIVATT